MLCIGGVINRNRTWFDHFMPGVYLLKMLPQSYSVTKTHKLVNTVIFGWCQCPIKVVSDTGNSRMMTIRECWLIRFLWVFIIFSIIISIITSNRHHHNEDEHHEDEKEDESVVGVARTGFGWGHHCGHITTTILIIITVLMMMLMIMIIFMIIMMINVMMMMMMMWAFTVVRWGHSGPNKQHIELSVQCVHNTYVYNNDAFDR